MWLCGLDFQMYWGEITNEMISSKSFLIMAIIGLRLLVQLIRADEDRCSKTDTGFNDYWIILFIPKLKFFCLLSSRLGWLRVPYCACWLFNEWLNYCSVILMIYGSPFKLLSFSAVWCFCTISIPTFRREILSWGGCQQWLYEQASASCVFIHQQLLQRARKRCQEDFGFNWRYQFNKYPAPDGLCHFNFSRIFLT